MILTFGGAGGRDPVRDYYSGGFQVALGVIDVLRRQLAVKLGPHGIRVVTSHLTSYDEAPDAWTAQFLGANAQKWSVTDYLDDESEPLLHNEALPVSLQAPDVELLDNSTREGIRTLRIRITPPPRANLLAVTVEAGERVVDAPVDGKSVPNDTSGDFDVLAVVARTGCSF